MAKDPTLHPLAGSEAVEPPRRFTWPFHYVPHPLCRLAARQLAQHIASQPQLRAALDAGKMLGVLVVREPSGSLAFLAAFSGNVMGTNHLPYFVPPIYDLLQPQGEFRTEEAAIVGINREIEQLEREAGSEAMRQQLALAKQAGEEEVLAFKQLMQHSKRQRDDARAAGALTPLQQEELLRESRFQKAELKRIKHRVAQRLDEAQARQAALWQRVHALKQERKRRSEALQRRIFRLFVVTNALGEQTDLIQLLAPALPPAGTGECCAPKLLQHAYRLRVKPLCMAEFWWGQSPQGEVRHHGHYYPACRSKCLPILPWMMRGLDVEENPLAQAPAEQPLDVLYDDEWLSVVNKPAGMLTQPGKLITQSLETRYRARMQGVSGPVVVHRLDQETSGVVVLAKNREAHKALQALFEQRQVSKRYVALLDGTVAASEGIIELPLRPNPDDRPRQMVDTVHGKAAITRFEVLERNGGTTRVAFYPLTGRTHQLRVHASHPSGLGVAIVGDMLYGRAAGRLMLHAEQLCFTHPFTGKRLVVSSPAPF
ncbi:MAG: RNA pseudouridine synthase [Muribaculaceae bacterium]|nr:RNA pseudouridine synthase [Muribaculaceae bacterium]